MKIQQDKRTGPAGNTRISKPIDLCHLEEQAVYYQHIGRQYPTTLQWEEAEGSGRGTSNGCLEAYWFAECGSSQQVCSHVFSLELQHQSRANRRRRKNPPSTSQGWGLHSESPKCDGTSKGKRAWGVCVDQKSGRSGFACSKSPRGPTVCRLCNALTPRHPAADAELGAKIAVSSKAKSFIFSSQHYYFFL